MKKFKWLVPGLLFISSCTSTNITTSWKSETDRPGNYKKILVLGLVVDADRTIRENMENHMAGDLKALGYEALSALKEYGPKAFDGLNEEAAVSKIRDSGIDAVLTIVLLDKERERRYVPGHLSYSPYGFYYNRFWGYYGTMNRRIYEPGYYVNDTRYFWESNLYDMKTQRLIYSVQTQSFDPATSETLGHEYGRLIVKNMVKEGVLKNSSLKPF